MGVCASLVGLWVNTHACGVVGVCVHFVCGVVGEYTHACGVVGVTLYACGVVGVSL